MSHFWLVSANKKGNTDLPELFSPSFLMTISELTTSLAADSGNWELRLSLVQALIAEGRHESAVEVVNQGEAIPHEPGPWLAAAKTYAAVGATEQARGLVASALEIDPDYEPAKRYKAELSPAVRPPVVSLTAADLEDEEIEVLAVAAEPTIALVKKSGDGSPMTLPKVTFSSQEIEALRDAEEAVKQRNLNSVRRDKLNSLVATVILHIAIFAALTLVATQELPRIPPQIIASATIQPQQDQITDVKMSRPMLAPAAAASSAAVDIISVNATSSFSVSSVDVKISDVTAAAGSGSSSMGTGMSFNPSMSLGMATSSESRMLFGQPMEMKGDGNEAQALHVRNFLDCVKSRKRPNADVEEGHLTATMCHLGNIATRLNRLLKCRPSAKEREELLRLLCGRHRPQPGPAASTHDDGIEAQGRTRYPKTGL